MIEEGHSVQIQYFPIASKIDWVPLIKSRNIMQDFSGSSPRFSFNSQIVNGSGVKAPSAHFSS